MAVLEVTGWQVPTLSHVLWSQICLWVAASKGPVRRTTGEAQGVRTDRVRKPPRQPYSNASALSPSVAEKAWSWTVLGFWTPGEEIHQKCLHTYFFKTENMLLNLT